MDWNITVKVCVSICFVLTAIQTIVMFFWLRHVRKKIEQVFHSVFSDIKETVEKNINHISKKHKEDMKKIIGYTIDEMVDRHDTIIRVSIDGQPPYTKKYGGIK